LHLILPSSLFSRTKARRIDSLPKFFVKSLSGTTEGRRARICTNKQKLRGDAMAVLLQEYSSQVIGPEGTAYDVRSYGEERADGTWIGWLEFRPTDLSKAVLTTGQETSQPNRTSVEYWATGLEPVYFEGAFGRAKTTD
jgi:hypothetical protein